jgi:hypothetical protein
LSDVCLFYHNYVIQTDLLFILKFIVQAITVSGFQGGMLVGDCGILHLHFYNYIKIQRCLIILYVLVNSSKCLIHLRMGKL